MARFSLRLAGSLVLACSVFVPPASAQLRPGQDPASQGAANQDAARTASPLRVLHLPAARRALEPAFDANAPFRGAERSLAANAVELGIEGMQWEPHRVLRGHGLTVVRFRRVALGLPMTADALVVYDAEGRAALLLAKPGSATVDERARGVDAPRAAAVRQTGWVAARPMGERLVAFDDGTRVRRAWEVEVQGALHERALVFFDAADGALLAQKSLIRHQMGRVWEPNPVISEDMPADVELGNLTSARFLTGRYVRAQQCTGSGCNPGQLAMADAEGNFLFDPEEPSYDDPFVEVNLYHHTDIVAAYFRAAHDFEWTCCDRSSIIEAIGNYVERPRTPFANAFYSPSQCSRDQCAIMAFGQGRTIDFGYDGDVVYHEFVHGIVDVTANLDFFVTDRRLGISYEPGALNEGYADYFSSTITNDPKLADYVSSEGGSGEASLRDLDNDFVCPNDLFGESHADGRIWGGALWSIREVIGAEKADALAFAALLALPGNATIAEAAEVLQMTATELATLTDADRTAVDDELTRRGLLGCDRIVPMELDRGYGGYSGIEFATGGLGAGVAPLHYSIEVPVDATELTFRIRSLTPAGEYDIHMKVGEPNRYIGPRVPGLVGDAVFEDASVVTLTEDSEFALPRCQTLFLGIRTTDLDSRGQSIYILSAEMETSGDPSATCPELPEDAGPGGEDAGAGGEDAGVEGSDGGGADAGSGEGGGGGCGCRSASGVAGAWPLLFGLVLVRRRRR